MTKQTEEDYRVSKNRSTKETPRMRCDVLNGMMNKVVVFAFRGGDNTSMVREFMASVYRVRPETEAASYYEFALFMLDSKVAVDFHKNLFDQPRLAPCIPALATYRMDTPYISTALVKARQIITELMEFENDLDVYCPDFWRKHFEPERPAEDYHGIYVVAAK